MDRRRRLAVVQFWLVVDGLRTPLEDDISSDEEVPSSVPMWTQSDRNDLAQIHDAYLSGPQLKIAEKSKESVRQFLKAGNHASRQQYIRARSAILKTQSYAYQDMEAQDFPEFKTTELYYKYLASDDAHGGLSSRSSEEITRSSSRTSSNLQTKPSLPHLLHKEHPTKDLEDWDFDTLAQTRVVDAEEPSHSVECSPQASGRTPRIAQTAIVEAMEAALNDIIEQRPVNISGHDSSQHREGPPTEALYSRRSSLDISNERDDRIRPVLKERSKKQPPSIASLGLVKGIEESVFAESDELFPDDDAHLKPVSEDGSPSREQQSSEDDEVHQAAPGDLGLAEAISALSYDIEKLFTQEAVIDSLYRKAELTNNVIELRILKKSKASLQREIRRKELQRQQYIVQESDNSLFVRALGHV